MSYSITMVVNDREYRRLGRVAKHLDYVDSKGKGDISEMMREITRRLVEARCSRDGYTYFAEAKEKW
ncbi:TPA: hypothetical protein ACT2JH_000200 [Salmonella enterica]|uniref:hypothetical protein n=1 Tax=Salmonella enterica TaxID=28901 RepID=UPI003ED82662